MQSAADAAAIGAAQNLAVATRSGAAGQATTIGNENLPKLTPNWNAAAATRFPTTFVAYPGRTASRSAPTSLAFAYACRANVPDPLREDPGFSNTGTSTVAIAALHGVGNRRSDLVPFAVGGSLRRRRLLPRLGRQRQQRAALRRTHHRELRRAQLRPLRGNRGLDDDIAARRRPRVHLESNRHAPRRRRRLQQAGPNTVLSDPGNTAGQETPGLLSGLGPFRRRRAGAPATGAGELQCVLARLGSRELGLRDQGAIDNRPLWEFIPTGLAFDVPVSCHRETFDALLAATPVAFQKVVMHAALTTCIKDYVAAGSTAPVFTANTAGIVDHGLALFDIQSSPRFVYTPQSARRGAPQRSQDVPHQGVPTRCSSSAAVPTTRRRSSSRARGTETRSPTTRLPTPPRSCSRRGAPAVHPRLLTPAGRCSPGRWARSTPLPIVIGANAVIELVG